MSDSRVFPVLHALFDLFTAELPDVAVFRGKYVTVPDADFLCVGWQPGVVQAVVLRQDYESLSEGAIRSESFTVHCYLETLTGDTDEVSVKAREDRLDGYRVSIQSLLRANKKLSGATGTPGYAQYAGEEFTPDENAGGFVAGLSFDVDVEAHI